MRFKQTLLDKAALAGLLTMLLGFIMIGYVISVSYMIRYSRPEDGNPALMLGWAAVSIMTFIAMIITLVAVIHIVPNKKI